MENKEYIRELLDKYLDGISTSEEEAILKEYFKSGNVPKEFRSEAHWFEHVGQNRINNDNIFSLEKRMSLWVDQQERKEKSLRLRSWMIGVAAGIAILVGVTFYIQHYQTKKIVDSYQDPQIAYLEARKVLLYVSQTFNKGTDKLQTVSRIEEGSNEMSIFSTFGSGLKNLELVSKYNDESTAKQ